MIQLDQTLCLLARKASGKQDHCDQTNDCDQGSGHDQCHCRCLFARLATLPALSPLASEECVASRVSFPVSRAIISSERLRFSKNLMISRIAPRHSLLIVPRCQARPAALPIARMRSAAPQTPVVSTKFRMASTVAGSASANPDVSLPAMRQLGGFYLVPDSKVYGG